jgi:regulation of enolase protein 1 (concanavalin A-like superfamily)
MKNFLFSLHQPTRNNMKTTTLGILLIVFSTAGFAQRKDSKTDLTIPAIPFPLSWDVKAVDFKVTGNNITIQAGKETDMYCFLDGSYYINNAPKLLFTPDSSFIFSVKIRPSFKTTYDGGALLIYSDQENWAKVLFEKHEDGSVGLGVSMVKNKKGDDSYHGVVNDSQVTVKAVRSGNIFCFYYSDGKTWRLLRTFPYEEFNNLRIGFYAQSPKGESCTVSFEDIQYRGTKFTDFFTGE